MKTQVSGSLRRDRVPPSKVLKVLKADEKRQINVAAKASSDTSAAAQTTRRSVFSRKIYLQLCNSSTVQGPRLSLLILLVEALRLTAIRETGGKHQFHIIETHLFNYGLLEWACAMAKHIRVEMLVASEHFSCYNVSKIVQIFKVFVIYSWT